MRMVLLVMCIVLLLVGLFIRKLTGEQFFVPSPNQLELEQPLAGLPSLRVNLQHNHDDFDQILRLLAYLCRMAG